MSERVRWWAEGERAGVLVLSLDDRRWLTLARFRGPDAERMARELAEFFGARGLPPRDPPE